LKLDKLFEGVSLIGDYSDKIKDQILAQGEVLAAKLLVFLLNEKAFLKLADTRDLIVTDSNFGDAQPLDAVSKKNTIQVFKENKDSVLVFTGFIGSNTKQETTTLGRNGSNYTSLIANYINAEELQNFTHVDGIYTANPELVLMLKN
jgi:aspartate kinase